VRRHRCLVPQASVGPGARGSVPGLDQLDFVVVALAAVFVVDTDWALAVFTPSVLVVVLVMTPILHVVTNVGAYALGLKNEPW